MASRHRIANTWLWASRRSQATGPVRYINNDHTKCHQEVRGLTSLPTSNSVFLFIQIFFRAYVPFFFSWCLQLSLLPLTSEAFSDFPPAHTETSGLIPLQCAVHNCTRLSCLCPLGFPVHTCRDVLKLFPNTVLSRRGIRPNALRSLFLPHLIYP